MIVGDLNLDGALIRPAKTNAPLIVDADAVLTFPVATQRFEAVGRRKPKVSQISRRNNTLKPYPRSTQDGERQAANSESLEYLFGALVLEPRHDPMITHHVNNVKGYY